jgi:hypothetical protein
VLGNLEDCFLVPGNSIGLRLPLDSLQNFKTREIVVDRSLFEDLPALGDYEKVKKRYGTISKLFQATRVLSKKERGKRRNLI